MNSSYQLSTVDRPLALCARRDIQLAPTAFAGQAAFVLKDPLTLELFHLTAEEFFLFQALQVKTTLGKLRREFERRFAPRRITPEALQYGLNQLHSQGLLISEAPAQGHELLERADKRRHEEWLLGLTKMLSFRLGSVDATGFIDGLHARLRWLFSWPVFAAIMALFAYASWILLGHGREVVSRLPSLSELSQPRYWPMWIATIAIVKVLHELGHALACQHFGGRCHEMGVLMLGFIPCLYCDVTDAWRISTKWRRIAVSAAGMTVELVIAAAALIAWWHTQPGLLNSWCLSVVIVCSVGTLLVNANPLMRYDGYYILSDLVEVPNLASRAQGLLSEKLRRWLLHEPAVDDPLLGPRRRRGLLVYAIASKVYLTLLVVFIFAGLLALARPYRMENLIYTVAAVTLIGMFINPVAAVWRIWKNPKNRAQLRGPRTAMFLAVIAALIAAICFWPIDRNVIGPAVFVPAEGQAVYATVGGELTFALPAGSVVRQGDVVARLANAEMDLKLAEQEGEYQVRRVTYEQLEALRAIDDKASAKTPAAEAALAAAEAQLAEGRRQAEELTLTAPRDGVVIGPPTWQPQDVEEGMLSTWTGSPLDPRNAGCWLEPGAVVCTIADPQRLDALVAIDQADVPEVQSGQVVRILTASSPVRILEGEVVEVARRGTKRAVAEPTSDPGKYHLVEVRLKDSDTLLLVGSRGTAKIEANSTTLGTLVLNQLRRMLKLPW